MDRKNDLTQQYKETESVAGVYQIKNKYNQKVFTLMGTIVPKQQAAAIGNLLR